MFDCVFVKIERKLDMRRKIVRRPVKRLQQKSAEPYVNVLPLAFIDTIVEAMEGGIKAKQVRLLVNLVLEVQRLSREYDVQELRERVFHVVKCKARDVLLAKRMLEVSTKGERK